VTAEIQTALFRDVLPIQTTTITTEGTTIREDREVAETATAEAQTVLLQDQVPAEISEETETSREMKTEDSLLRREADSEAEATEEAETLKTILYRPAA